MIRNKLILTKVWKHRLFLSQPPNHQASLLLKMVRSVNKKKYIKGRICSVKTLYKIHSTHYITTHCLGRKNFFIQCVSDWAQHRFENKSVSVQKSEAHWDKFSLPSMVAFINLIMKITNRTAKKQQMGQSLTIELFSSVQLVCIFSTDPGMVRIPHSQSVSLLCSSDHSFRAIV